MVGDMSDYDIEQGMDMLAAHQGGQCFQDCLYCDKEAVEAWYTEMKDET